MPPPPAFGAVLSSTWLLFRVRTLPLGDAGMSRRSRLPSRSAPVGDVSVHLGAVRGSGHVEVQDAAAAESLGLATVVCWLRFTELLFSVSFAALDGSKVALAIPPPAATAALPLTLVLFNVTAPPEVRDPAAEVGATRG